MHHPIPRFADVPIAPIPDCLARFHDAEQAIAARSLDPRPPELDSHIGWFPSIAKEKSRRRKALS